MKEDNKNAPINRHYEHKRLGSSFQDQVCIVLKNLSIWYNCLFIYFSSQYRQEIPGLLEDANELLRKKT